jgi:quercetin dioxygenase-like cupin family protein
MTIAALLLNGDGRRAGKVQVRSIMRNRQATYLMITAVAGFALAVTALATPGSGVLSAPVLARANFLDPVDIKFKIKHGSQEVLHVPNTRETVVQQIVISPGGHTGWHSHPGPVVVLVKAGALTFYSSEDPECVGRTYAAGQAFIDSGQGHVHIARNESASADIELWAVYFDVPPGGAFRIDAPAPGNCSF